MGLCKGAQVIDPGEMNGSAVHFDTVGLHGAEGPREVFRRHAQEGGQASFVDLLGNLAS